MILNKNAMDLTARPAKPYSQKGLRGELPKFSGNLSPRLKEAMDKVCEGKSNKVIAYEMGLTLGSIKAYLYHSYKILGVHSRYELMVKQLKK